MYKHDSIYWELTIAQVALVNVVSRLHGHVVIINLKVDKKCGICFSLCCVSMYIANQADIK